MDGIIIIDKPKGFTSHDVVGKLRRILNMKKIGHTGTLDPNATGVLPICLGVATKASNYLIEHDKIYEVELKLGEQTDTGDAEGNVINVGAHICAQNVDIQKEEIDNILQSFLGKQQQIPPMYSAIKIDGKKLYQYAREGIEVERKAREIEIYDIVLNDLNLENNTIKFTVNCSKGTYIRVLCEDIAAKLGTYGYMNNLRRIMVGDFKIEESVTLDYLEENKDNLENISKNIISLENIFINSKKIIVNNARLPHFLNGVNLTFNLEDGTYRVYDEENKFIGIGLLKNNLLKRDIIL